MVEYRANRDISMDGRLRSGAGGTIAIVVVVFAFIMGALFASGFWSVDVRSSGSLPQVKVNVAGGHLPNVAVKSKEVVVGTQKASVDVPAMAIKEN